MPKLINKVRDLNMSQVESGPPSIHLEPTEPQQVTPSYAVKNAKTTKLQPQQKLPNQQLQRFSNNTYTSSEEEVIKRKQTFFY